MLLSPVHGVLDPQTLSEWMLADRLPCAAAAAAAQVHLVARHAGRLTMRAVVLLSGGLDSYTAAAIAKSRGLPLYALTIATVSATRARSRRRARVAARARR